MNNAASDELAALCMWSRWCASERRIVRRCVEVRPDEVVPVESVEVATDLATVA